MKAFVITLMDVKESVQCADRCIESGERFGIHIEKFSAVDAKNSRELAENYDIPLDRFGTKWSRFENVLGCFMSHYLLWSNSFFTGEEILILEHDAVIMNEIPKCYYSGVLSLGSPSYGNFINPPKLGVNKLVSKQYFPGAHAYMVKPSAARILMEKASEACPTDVYLHNNRFAFLEEYYPWPVEARDTFSTVQNRNGIQAKHSYQKNPEVYRLV